MSDRLSVMKLKKGFTIVELAVVLVLVGILITLGVKMIGPLTQRARVSDTKGTIDAAMEAVVGFAATNRRLPDPTNNQIEFRNNIRKPNDAWGNPLYYIVDSNLYLTGADQICGRKTTGITVRNCITDNCATTAGTDYNDIPNVAFIIASGGENFNMQSGTIGGRVAVYVQNGAADRDDCTNAVNCLNYVGTMIPLRPGEKYDDIIKWVTLNELRTKIGCQGAQLQILNNELPSTSLGSSYTANVFAAGGVPYLSGTQSQYRWCVEIRNRTAAQGPPNGVSFNPSFIRYPDSAQYCSDQVEVAWPAWANNLVITKTINSTETGSFSITVFTRDHNSSALNSVACNDTSSSTNRDNCTNKPFVLTISP